MMSPERSAFAMPGTEDALIDLELERAFAMSRAWDEAAEALKRANRGEGELSDCDRALAKFWELESSTREAGGSNKAPASNQ